MRRLRQTHLQGIIFATAGIWIFGVAAELWAGPKHEPTPHGDEPIPSPVVGQHLFTDDTKVSLDFEPRGNAQTCLTAEDVRHVLVRDVETIGGKIVIMADGVQQDFSDTWRVLVGASRVEISVVLAHVVPDPGDPIVDVVEIDGQGCALSRTLLAASDFLDLFEHAHQAQDDGSV